MRIQCLANPDPRATDPEGILLSESKELLYSSQRDLEPMNLRWPMELFYNITSHSFANLGCLRKPFQLGVSTLAWQSDGSLHLSFPLSILAGAVGVVTHVP